MIRPTAIVIGATALAGVGMLVIPIPRPSPDFSAIAAADAQAAASGSGVTAALRHTRWVELMPKDWNPYQQLKEMQKGTLTLWDTDPRAAELLARLHDLWDNAPINPAFDGATVRIPGYVVPLAQSKQGLKEFLLVPYFGACIHSPPPPSNQIIRVWPREPVAGLRTMDAVWVGGRLKAVRSDSSMGTSSYGLDASLVEPYTAAKRN